MKEKERRRGCGSAPGEKASAIKSYQKAVYSRVGSKTVQGRCSNSITGKLVTIMHQPRATWSTNQQPPLPPTHQILKLHAINAYLPLRSLEVVRTNFMEELGVGL